MIQRKVVEMNRVFRPELLNLDRAYGWWMSELAAIGQDIAHCIPHRPRTLIEVRIDRKGDAWAVLLGTSEVRCKAESQDELRSVLAKMRRACPRAPHVQLCLAPQSYLVREVRLPASAKNEVWPILELELKRATPFGADQVYQGFRPRSEGSSNEIKVDHIIVKRSQLEWVLNTVRAEDYTLLPRIKVMHNETAFDVELRPAICALGPKRLMLHRLRSSTAVAAIASIMLLFGLLYWRQTTALAELSLRTEATRERAMVVRTKLSKLEQDAAIFSALHERRRQKASIIAILRELTELIPDGAWLTELRIEQDAILLTGQARSSADLLVAFEASPLFDEVRFTSPIIRAPGESVERFSIRLELQSSGKLSSLERTEP
jgi:general secretion pathway protein L